MEYKLRPWSPDDLDNLVTLANNYNIARFMADEFPHPYTVENGKGFISMAASHDPLRILAIEVEGKAAGGIGIHPQSGISRKNAELGYWLGEPYWGKGIITEAVKEMLRYGFENFDIDRIFARPFGNNPASQRVLEKAGFVLEATLKGTYFKFGEKLDELIYAVRRDGNQ
jgi:[ribosomal protein S5]-alanine N-acetyltransferase